jgi:hypothetical protein
MTTLILALLLGIGFYLSLSLMSLAFRPMLQGIGNAALFIFTWALTINITFLCSYWDLPRWGILVLLTALIGAGLVVNRHILLKKLASLAPYWMLGMLTVLIAVLPLIYSFPADAVITEFGVCNDSVHHAYLGKGFVAATNILSAMKVYPQGSHSVLWFLSWLLNLEPIFLLLPVTLIFSSLTPLALLQVGEYDRRLSSSRLYFGALCTGTCFILVVSCYFLFTAQCVVTPLSLTLAIRSLYISRLRRTEFVLLAVVAMAALNTYNIMGLAPMGVAMILNYRGWSSVGWHLLGDIATAIRRNGLEKLNLPASFQTAMVHTELVTSSGSGGECSSEMWNQETDDGPKANEKVSWILLSLVLTLSLVSAYPNLISFISKFLPYFFGQNPLGENLWAASGVMPGYIETIHIIGIWPLASDFRAALPDGTYKVIGAISLLVAGMLLSKAPRSMQGLSIVGIVLYTALSFSGTYLNFKVLALAAPLISFAVFFAVIDLVPVSKKRVTGLVGCSFVTLLLFSYSRSIKSFHSQNIVTKSQIDDLLALKKLYVDTHDVLLLDNMEFASYVIDDLKDFSPFTNYLYRPWNGSSVDLVIVNRGNREKAKEYLAQQKMGMPGKEGAVSTEIALALSRSCRVSHFKQWDIYRICES